MAGKLRWTTQRKGSTAMNSRLFFSCRLWLALATCIVFASQVSEARDLTQLSGTYEVIGKTDAGPNTSIRLRIHVTNQGAGSLSVQRIALRDFSHPVRDRVRASALTIPAGGTADSTQEFTLPRLEYDSWQHGNQPKLVLEIVKASGRRTTEVLTLTRISNGKGN